ncbi:TPA: hypothetical protein IAC10_13015 [Candidatus Scatousia excrementigallinarum]|uniref:Uncharacterized protein n=1 Tax=Candidatus Scatousia excrementigallinarum TaxID=2840935 RepID=A0A9D1JPE3_9BACT|nr:hypothetical protein [Candidatus Scatousia excrementigallinarum]
MDRVIEFLGKFILWLLVILFLIGSSFLVVYFVMRSQGMTYYVEFKGERYYANSDGGNITLIEGELSEFSVKSLTDEDINYSVCVTSNYANNFRFSVRDELYKFYGDDEELNDYSEIFDLQKTDSGFTVCVPRNTTLTSVIEQKFNGSITFFDEINEDLSYFVITVSSGASSVSLWFDFEPIQVGVDPPKVTF